MRSPLSHAAEIAFWAYIGGMFTATAIVREEYVVGLVIAAFFITAAGTGLLMMWSDSLAAKPRPPLRKETTK